MNKQAYVRRRRRAWRRFEQLADRVETRSARRLTPREISVFSRMFRELCSDLALARSSGWGHNLVYYLNNLVGRAHNGFYSAPARQLQGFLEFISVDFPRQLRAEWAYMLVAAVLFFLPFGVAATVVYNDPSLAARVVDPRQLELMAEMYDFDPDRDPQGPMEQRAAMGGFYVQHNIGIALRSFVGGILLGIVTVHTLISNGLIIGVIGGYVAGQSSLHARAFTSFVVTHGAFELTALVIAGGAGLVLGDAILHPRQRTRREALHVRGGVAVRLACGAAIMLAIAALIEAFWSPSAVPSVIKYAVGVTMWVLVGLFLVLAGRES